MTEWIISSSLLILVIIIHRRVFRSKISLRLPYALWGIVLVHLLHFSLFESSLSVMNVVEDIRGVEMAQTAQELWDMEGIYYSTNEPVMFPSAPQGGP